MKTVAYHFDESLDHMGYTKGDPPPYGTLLHDDENDQPLLQFYGTTVRKIEERPKFSDIAKKKDWRAIGDAQVTATIVESAIRRTRFLMKRGTLNHLLPREDVLNPEHSPPIYDDPTHRPGYLCEPLSPAYLDSIGNSIHAKFCNTWRGADLGQFASLIGRYYAGVRLQAGVCSNMSAVAIAMLTMDAPVEGQFGKPKKPFVFNENETLSIIDLSHSGEHSFCLASYGQSPWFVCDPWVAEPYVIPLEENYFPEEGITSWSEIRVHRRLEHPFGLPSMALWDNSHGDKKHNVENFPVDNLVIRQVEKYLVDSVKIDFDIDMVPNDAFQDRGANANAFRKYGAHEDAVSRRIAHRFHTDHVWVQPSNHKLSDPELDQEEWLKYRKEHPPVVRGNEWGDKVDMNPGYVTKHNSNVDFDKNKYREDERAG